MSDDRLKVRVVFLLTPAEKEQLDILCRESPPQGDGRPMRVGQYLRSCLHQNWAARGEKIQEEVAEMSKTFNIAGCPGGQS